MSGQAIELLDLVARWLHVIAGTMWIGNSLLFNWLDRSLRPRAEPDVYGDIWLIHSGGFYLVEKNQGERAADGRRSLPAPLHWFKWQAYTTWLSGAVLLIVVYYMGGRALLVDPSVAPLGHRAGVAIAVATIVGGWAIYETIWRTLGERSRFGAGLLSILLLVAFANSLLTGLSGRAAFVHVGALLGTIMAGNVAFTIMPSQRELVAALKAGREPSQAVADRAKTRSIHNNYLTFPVIALMMSAHFPSLYANGGPVPLLTLIAAGAAVRYALNIRFTNPYWQPVMAGVLIVFAALLMLSVHLRTGDSPGRAASVASAGPVDFNAARSIVDRRCAACHSATPSDVSLGVMPAGVAFDTPEQITALADRIRERAIATRTMPPGNKTRMTEEERTILARWLDQLPR